MSRTLPTPARRSSTRRPSRRGFTLMELLVVIGIITLLISIGLPALLSARKNAQKTRAKADMQAIAFALDAYRTDFGSYPRPRDNPAEMNVGFALLGLSLASPGGGAPTVVPPTFEPGDVTNYNSAEYVAIKAGSGQTPGAGSKFWQTFPYTDGSNGPGFRVRPGLGAKVYPPYLQAGKFKLRGLAVLDLYGNPILYFPASAKKPNTQVDFNYVDDWGANYPAPAAGNPPRGEPVFDVGHNVNFFVRNGDADNKPALQRMASFMIKDYDATKHGAGLIPAGVGAPMTMGPYVLWSAGADDVYGVTYAGANATKKDIDKCDDVVSFDR